MPRPRAINPDLYPQIAADERPFRIIAADFNISIGTISHIKRKLFGKQKSGPLSQATRAQIAHDPRPIEVLMAVFGVGYSTVRQIKRSTPAPKEKYHYGNGIRKVVWHHIDAI